MINFITATTGNTKTLKNPTSTRSRFNIFKYLSAFALVMLIGVNGVRGQTFTGTYSFASSNGNVASLTYNGTAITNLTVGALAKTGVTTSSSSGNSRATGYGTGSTNGGAAGGSIDLAKYYEFTITASSGYTISNPTLTFGVGRSGTGPRRFQWRWNVDTYGSALTVGTVNGSITHTSGVLETPDANLGYTGNVITTSTSGQSTITFRFYPYGAEDATGTGGLQGDLTFGGTLSAASATDYFWNGGNLSNNTNNTWNNNTTLNWGITNGATFTANNTPGVVWPTSGSYNANFNNAAAATSVSLPAAISVTPNSTVIGTSGYTFAPSVTQTFGSPITLNNTLTIAPAASTVFTLSSIASGTGGLIHNGSGATTLSAANTFTTAGFILTNGTVVVGNANALGAASSPLALNGGTISATGSAFTLANTAITVGGNFQLGEIAANVSTAGVGNLTFGGTVDLGSSVRTITLGNTGAHVFSGVISNTSGGLTFTANNNGTGRFDITNAANTFTGPININGNGTGVAEVRFTADGSLGNTSNTININGGRLATLSAATYTLTSTRGIQVGNTSGTSISTPGAGVLTYDGVISDLSGSTPGAWAKQGGGTLSLGGVSTYTGTTAINNGTLRLTTGNDRLPIGTALTLGQASSANVGTFDLNGRNQTIASLNSTTGTNASASFNNTITSSSAATLTVNGNGSYGDGTNANSGIITGSVALVKSGSGTLTLADANTYTGGTTVTGGTLTLGASDILANSGAVNVDGGILNSSGAFTETIGALTLTSGSITGATGTLTPSSMAVQAGTIDVILAGSGVMTKSTSGTAFLTNANSYSGGTVINGGILSANGASRLGSASGSLTINNGTFQFTTTSITSGRDIILGDAASTFKVVGSNISYSITNGVISGTGTLNKTGTGILACSTACTYSGSTKIMGGIIRLNAANIFPSTELFLDGGTLSTGATSGFTETVGTLNLNSTGTIALGTGSHTLTFANSSAVSWAGTTLNITGWTGTAGASGTAGKIFVGSDATGLTASQLLKISFSGYAGVTAIILSTGEIVPDISLSPTISTVGTLSAVNTTYGTASATPTTFTVSGTNLTADISISAPSGYEISQTSPGTTGYATTQTLTQSGGTVSSTTIYVRLTSTAIPNSYSGNVALTSTVATPVNVATASSTVTAKALTITGLTADSRTYDGTTGATFTGTPALSGVVNSDVVSITGSGTASFVTKTVGTTKTVNVTGYSLTGANASNYSLTQPTLSADINTATLTVASGATVSNKTYDGNTTATVSAGTLGGTIYGLDAVSISTSGIFADANVGTSISVTLALTGADAGNYTLTQPGRTANITIASQTITFNALASKLTTDAAFALTATASSGLTVSYISSNTAVATISGSTVTLVGAGTTTITASQTGNSNYTAATSVDQNLIVSTPIAAGDIVIIGYGSTGTDKFAFLLNRDFPASTVLNFTDNAWTGSALNSNENTLVWTSPLSTLTAGTVVTITSNATVSSGHGSATGTINGLASNGDQVICYTGTNGSPTFIAAFSSIAWLTTGTATNATSYLPTGLTAGLTASNVVTQVDNMYYNNVTTGPISILKSLINNTSNWLTSASSQTIPTYSISFTTSATLTANATITNVVLASGETLSIGANTLTVTGAVSGLGTITGGTTSNLTIGGAAGTIQFTTGSTNNYLKNLTLNASSSMTIGSNALNITGGTTFGVVTVGTGATLATGGNLTLKSDANGTACIDNSAGSVSGNVTVERYVSGAGRRWRFLSSPVTSATVNNWMSQFYVTGPGDSVPANSVNGSTLGTPNTNGWHTSLANINYPSSGTHNSRVQTTSIRTYNESVTGNNSNLNAGWENLNATSQALIPGQGFRVFIRGAANNTAQLDGSLTSQSAITLSLNGTVNQGSITLNSLSSFPITNATQGWNLIGNPYPCAYDIAAHYTGNSNSLGANCSTLVYIYNPTAGTAGYAGYNANGGAASGTGLGAGIIPSGGAFFIKANGGSPTFTFQEAYKTTTTAPSGLHKTDVNDQFEIKYSKDTVESDYLTVKMYNGATLNYDAFDILKIRNDNLNLAAYGEDTMQVSASVIQPVVAETRIKLNVEATAIGTYNFDFKNMDNFQSNITVSLFDRYTNKTTDVRKNTKYTFDMGAGINQWGKNRFELILNGKATTGVNNTIANNSANTTLSVYPNPATDVLNISLSNGTAIETVNIYNISGKLVNNTKLNGNQIDISQLNNGVYMVEVITANGSFKTKFVK